MLNHVILLGRPAQTPELKMTTTGKYVTRFDLAVQVPGGKDTPPDYIPVTCWEKQAELVGRFVPKGRQIVVEGQIKTRKWTDSDGKNRKAVEVRASRIYFADSNNGGSQNGDTSQEEGFADIPDDEDLPF